MDDLRTDLRFAVRQLVRSPGFTAVAVLTLALGIGANSALYTLADAVVRRPRPGIGESSSLVWIAATTRERSRPSGLSYHVAARLRQEIPLLERVATIRDVPLSLATPGEPVKVKGQAVSGEYFSMLRTPFALGRGFSPSEDSAEGANPVVVLNHRTWQSSFGGDSSIVGRAVTLNGLPLTVIGVTAEGFNGAEHDAESRAAWVPASMLAVLLPEWRRMATDPTSSNIRVLARMRAESDRPQVEAAVRRLAGVIAASDSGRAEGWMMHVYRASAGLPAGGENAILPIAALSFAVTGLILLICCANVSNLMLARALSRQREIATRLSIGASRGRVVRQLLTESLLLAVLASVLGLAVATWGTRVVLATALPVLLDVSMDWRVFAVSALLALATGVLFGLAPALHATRGGVASVLRQAATGGDRERSRLQGGLVVAQVALSLMLLTMSGLFLRSLDKAQRIDVGFDASAKVLVLSYDLGLQRYDSARALAFTEQVLARARALPGVERASATNLLPLTEWSSAPVVAEGAGGAERSAPAPAALSTVDAGYFRTIATPIVAGRDFTDADARGAPLVAIVDEAFARQRFGGASALGARVGVDGEGGPWRTVVGVARDAVVQSLQAPAMGGVYVPLRQRGASTITILVRASGASAAGFGGALRESVRALDPELPVHRLTTLDRIRDEATSEQRAGAALLAVFGGLALALAALGLHGVMLFTVRQRTREIGIRMALGATSRAVTSIFVRRGLRLTLAGGVIGVVLALGATQLTRSLLFGIAPTDALTFVAVSVLFAVVALLACWLPARRASRVDPVRAMRAE